MACPSISVARFSSSFLLPAISLLLLAQLIETAIKTDTIVATYYPTTLRASPLLLFSFKEFINTIISDVFQVLNHAHMVKSAVALVESL